MSSTLEAEVTVHVPEDVLTSVEEALFDHDPTYVGQFFRWRNERRCQGMIKFMYQRGSDPTRIAEVLGVRYQFVRNTLRS